MSDALTRFNKIFDHAGKVVVGRELEIECIKYALLTKHHVLLFGPHGTAKSKIVTTIFDYITGKKFSAQFDKWMGPDDIFGPINIKEYRENFRFKRDMTRMVPDSHFIYADELLDANPALLRAMLSILNERTYMKGGEIVNCPLHTCVATTNFSDVTSLNAAVLDRFMFKCDVNYLDTKEARKQMLKSQAGLGLKHSEPKPITRAELFDLVSSVRKVVLPEMIIDSLEEFYALFNTEIKGANRVSDRRAVWAMDAIKAHAFLRGLSTAELEDLNGCYAVFGVAGRTEYQKVFAKCLANIISSKTGMMNVRNKADRVRTEFVKLVESTPAKLNAVQATKYSNELSSIYMRLTAIKDEARKFNMDENSDVMLSLIDLEDELASALHELKEQHGSPNPLTSPV